MISLAGWQLDLSSPASLLFASVLGVSLCLTVLAAGRRLAHRAPFRALLAMVLNVVAFTVLLILLLDPLHTHRSEKSVMLVTEGSDLQSLPPTVDTPVYIAPGFAASDKENNRLDNAAWLLDIQQLQLREPALTSIDVHGYGLNHLQWDSFDNELSIDFQPPMVNGFSNMQWQRSLAPGDTLHIMGRIQYADISGLIQIRLLDPAGILVSETNLRNGQNFTLATAIKAGGFLTYTLQAWAGDQLLSAQILPLEAVSTRALKLMIEQSAPSFETRQLKDFMSTQGHQLIINTQTSRDKSISQFINTSAGTITGFSPQTLSKQDLLILDGRTLAGFLPAQLKWLTEAVEQGLGILVLADSDLVRYFPRLSKDILKGFALSTRPSTDISVLPRPLTNPQLDWQQPLNVLPVEITAVKADTLVDDGQDRGLVVKRARGFGQIGVSLVNSSHSWLTSGNRKDWTSYWSVLLTGLTRQHSEARLIRPADTTFSMKNEKVEICALTAEEGNTLRITAAQDESGPVEIQTGLSPDRLGSLRQCAYFWPRQRGWHRVQLMSADQPRPLDQMGIYVFSSDQWPGQHRHDRTLATFAKIENSRASTISVMEKWQSESVDAFYLWLILILSASILWLERKLDLG